MEYVWIFILGIVYITIWICILDDLHKVYWKGINFCKAWLYAHIALIIIGLIGLFSYSLSLFIGK